MASDFSGKGRNIFEKMLRKSKGDSSFKRSSENKKKKELKLEAASVSKNFDPETYIIPLQNRWTFESNEQKRINKSLKFEDDSFSLNYGHSQSDQLKSTSNSETDHVFYSKQNLSASVFENLMIDEKGSLNIYKGNDLSMSDKNPAKAKDGQGNTGYVPSHARSKQRSTETGMINSSLFPDSEHFLPSTLGLLRNNEDKDVSDMMSGESFNGTERIMHNTLIKMERINSIPGLVESRQGHSYDAVNDLDIDRVELIPETDDEDRWSTPSLPALSMSSSDDSIDDHYDDSAQSIMAHSIIKNPVLSTQNITVVDQNDDMQHELTSQINSLENALNTIILNLEDQRQSIFKNAKISERSDGKLRRERTKDKKIMDRRFTRLESHVISLARSVAHLSSELRSQNKIHQKFAILQKEVHELTKRRDCEINYLQERIRLMQVDRISQKRIRKLRKFFGEDPGYPLLCNFLESIGYHEYSTYFQMAQIGLMELPYLNEEQLKDIGIPTGPRTRIIENAKHLH